MSAVADSPQILRAMPGRVRAHVPAWRPEQRHAIELHLRQLHGVTHVFACVSTGNVLVTYDPQLIDERQVLAALRPATLAGLEPTAGQAPDKAHVIETDCDRPGIKRARIPIRGLSRNPEIGRRIVERLRQRRGIKLMRVSTLTGRLLVEYDLHEVEIDQILGEIVRLDLPDTPEHDDPSHPLDPRPLLQSVTRLTGATLGLSLLGTRRAAAVSEPLPAARAAVRVATTLGILQGVPAFRYGIRRIFGRDIADALIYTPTIISLTLSGSVPGLLLMGIEALRLLTEVVPRRAAWRRYEELLSGAPSAEPGAVIRLESGERPPLDARVIEGKGTALGRDGLPVKLMPDRVIPAGARVFGGPFIARLREPDGFDPPSRPAPPRQTLTQRYANAVEGISFAYAALTALTTRSLTRTMAALLLVNPRPALIGADAAELGASARVLRAGMTIVGTRAGRSVRLPDALLLDGPRTLIDGWETNGALSLTERYDASEILTRAGEVAAAAGTPWGGALRLTPKSTSPMSITEGTFDGETASARLSGVRYWLRSAEEADVPPAFWARHQGECLLLLGSERDERPIGVVVLRPRLAAGVHELVGICRMYGVELAVLPGGDEQCIQAIAQRARIDVLPEDDPLEVIGERQAAGDVVAFVSDNALAGAALAACDIGIGLTTGRCAFPARADFLAPDLIAVAAFVDAGARQRAAARDAIGFSVLSNLAGGVVGLRTAIALENASTILYGAAFGAMGDQWLQLRGGARPRLGALTVTDPRPERWGAQSVPEVLKALATTADGLSSEQVGKRARAVVPVYKRAPLWELVLDQLKSPLTAVLGVGAAASLVFAAPADMAIIAATIGGNVALGAWQARKADVVAETLNRLGATSTTVLRDGKPLALPAPELVPGDVLLLAPGTHIAADARLIEAEHLEVDEASLTGESLPTLKAPDGPTDAGRVVLDGSDVTMGTGKAVVFAVGRDTRMGATAAAFATNDHASSPLDKRLSESLQQIVPVALVGGALVTGAGFLRTGMPLPSLGTGATIALASIPEGLPILSRVSEAGVAKRLADRHALTRRLSAVEALGRVDVACADKTGTLTRGHLALTLVANARGEQTRLPGPLAEEARHILLTAALASPAADALDAQAHPTDVAVVRAAREAGLEGDLRAERLEESPFDPIRALHATRVPGRLCLKGAPEALVPRCAWVRGVGGALGDLDEGGRAALRARADALARQGLRVLMVAEGPAAVTAEEARDLTALGFIGISDPLRPDVPAAVRRCHEAGIRVVMITGDHPATAEAIARQAGLVNGLGRIVTADELADLEPDALDDLLSEATVIARATPLDKLRIIESLQRQGHTVAMTGDGVNDAPALRLADVGIAMGRGGTEVARQTADVVLTDDDFSTLVEALVEGRSFWHNIRRGVGLLIGGNLGELGLVVGASVLGLGAPLTARQILVVNMISDILPGLAVALQQPENRNLAALAREGTAALDRPLRNDVLRRGAFTAGPSLAAYALALGRGSPQAARTVALASIVTTQLGQTLDVGWSEGHLTRPLVGAVAGSAGLLGAAIVVPQISSFLGLALPSPLGLALIGGATLASMGLSRAFNGATIKNGQTTKTSAATGWRLIAEAGAGAGGQDGHAEESPPLLLAAPSGA